MWGKSTPDFSIMQEPHVRHCDLQRQICQFVERLGRLKGSVKRLLYPPFGIAWACNEKRAQTLTIAKQTYGIQDEVKVGGAVIPKLQ